MAQNAKTHSTANHTASIKRRLSPSVKLGGFLLLGVLVIAIIIIAVASRRETGDSGLTNTTTRHQEGAQIGDQVAPYGTYQGVRRYGANQTTREGDELDSDRILEVRKDGTATLKKAKVPASDEYDTILDFVYQIEERTWCDADGNSVTKPVFVLYRNNLEDKSPWILGYDNHTFYLGCNEHGQVPWPTFAYADDAPDTRRNFSNQEGVMLGAQNVPYGEYEYATNAWYSYNALQKVTLKPGGIAEASVQSISLLDTTTKTEELTYKIEERTWCDHSGQQTKMPVIVFYDGDGKIYGDDDGKTYDGRGIGVVSYDRGNFYSGCEKYGGPILMLSYKE